MQDGSEQEVDVYLRRKYGVGIKEVETVEREDPSLVTPTALSTKSNKLMLTPHLVH